MVKRRIVIKKRERGNLKRFLGQQKLKIRKKNELCVEKSRLFFELNRCESVKITQIVYNIFICDIRSMYRLW